jgi:hypothetical protein
MRLQRPVLAVALLLGSATTLSTALPAQATLQAAASGRATTEVVLAWPRDSAPAGAQPTSIRIDYGQPHLRGRRINSDSLVPWDKPWRTGANAATTLTTGVDLLIGGQALPKGTYVLWTLPSRTGWKLIVQRPAAPGTAPADAQYDASRDVARIDLRAQPLAAPLESLTMWLIPSRAAGLPRGELRLAWGTTMLATDWSMR